MRRNLIYSVYPVRGSHAWRWNVAQMRRYLAHFDGKKIVTVTQDGAKTDPAEEVAAAFGASDIEVVETANDPVLQQTKAFIPSLEKVRSMSKDEATFYAFAKGVTHGPDHLINVTAWTWAQYFLNLACLDLVDRLLSRWGAVGAFKHYAANPATKWHYSGAFFWFRHDALFSRPSWREFQPDRWGVEYYLGRHIPPEEAFDLADGKTNGPDGVPQQLYWRKVRLRECERWLLECIGKELSA